MPGRFFFIYAGNEPRPVPARDLGDCRVKNLEKPALVVELKWDKNASGAISQIKEKECCRSLEEYRGNILLVGVNYNKKTKEHECIIEEISLP